MRAITRWVVVYGTLLLGGGWAGAESDLPDPGQLMDSVRRVQESDLRSWQRYAFRRQVVRRQLTAAGEVRERQLLDFELVPTERGFDERLTRIDGRSPRASEVRSHRRAERFGKHYRQAKTGEAGDDEGFSLFRLVHLGGYRVSAREPIEGAPCYRLDFGPSSDTQHEVLSKFSAAMEGSLWVDTESMHIARARARTVKPVPLSFGVVRILELAVEVDAAPVGDSVWLPRRIDVSSTLSILGKRVRKRNTFTYTGYSLARPSAGPR